MSSDIKPTDVVTLKSGGQAMTVEKIGTLSPDDPEIYASLIWFDEADGKLARNRLPVTLLVKKETAP